MTPDIPEDIRARAKAVCGDQYTALGNAWKPDSGPLCTALESIIARALLSERTRATEEIEALKHDLNRYIAISAELATENEELRASIRTEGTKP